MASHYDLLGLPATASQDEIRAAYRALARRHHPDTQYGVDPATADRSRQTMAALNAAWAVLGDPTRRRAYDAGLAGGRAADPPALDPWRPLATTTGRDRTGGRSPSTRTTPRTSTTSPTATLRPAARPTPW